MSRSFLTVVILLLLAFSAFETSINLLNRWNDEKIAQLCSKPAGPVPRINDHAIFYVPANRL